MKHSLNISSGKNTFGVFKESQTAGDYINNKKAKTTFCSGNICIPSKKVDTQSNLLLLRRANYLKYYACSDFNTSNLNVNLLTTLDLSDIPVIQTNTSPYESPATITLLSIPFLNYIIDPSGNLFGNNTCGLLNFENYLRPNST
jgi:hypothetical protein